MKMKKTIVVLLIGLAIGWVTLGGTQVVMHATSDTEFCLSCHTMKIPYEEYQSSIHYSNPKGIRAECSDCHIPQDTVDYLITKIRASKDIYHEFVTGKIDTEEKYEEHRMSMAQTVWDQMKANDSATCRSCHEFDAMDTYEQSEEAVKMHAYGQENNQTCIECHKGVAHFPPVLELDSEAFDNLFSLAEETKDIVKNVVTINGADIGEFGRINPAVQIEVIKTSGNNREVKLSGYQMKGAEQVIYMGEGKRSIIATLSEKGQAALDVGEYKVDEYDNEWRQAELVITIDAPVLPSFEPMWAYAEELDNVYCSACHAKIPPGHFTVNAWGPVAKGMGERTDISELDLEILTKYFQNHAKDIAGSGH
ncbi:NapC/NirT family cytochrome c [Vibrio sp. DW001]|uniref:NapC/NirT family cytochrome c n=1 Tax=Vibrio sp. DW001 TaxID=2912315 RepID=UPI0023AFEC83|nr:NapC/NirT family cytochrome c [Vibrio sp. DW001]WED27642.1 NapC/NirT family cytochrome c [Vibrio sp. DW001]